MASFIPLYLEGDALALYLELRDIDQGGAEIIQKMKKAFTDGAFAALGKLIQMKLTGESIDVYVNNIRRLAGLVNFDKADLENMVKLTLVNGFLDNICFLLMHFPNMLKLDMSELLSHARILS